MSEVFAVAETSLEIACGVRKKPSKMDADPGYMGQILPLAA